MSNMCEYMNSSSSHFVKNYTKVLIVGKRLTVTTESWGGSVDGASLITCT